LKWYIITTFSILWLSVSFCLRIYLLTPRGEGLRIFHDNTKLQEDIIFEFFVFEALEEINNLLQEECED